jgi:citrate lyase subunit beta/citryl-CoA lyase
MHGSAGRRGDDVRSDLYVEIDPKDSGEVVVQLKSKVAALYGQAIAIQATRLLAELGVEHAAVLIEDQGALPFTIAARIEAAAGRATPAPTTARPPSDRKRLRRSRLYLPGNEPKFMVNAGLHGADAVILDLEDSVHPGHKLAARALVRHALRALDFGEAERMVRINQLPFGLEDLAAVVPEAPDLILVPKVEAPDQVREVEAALVRHSPDRPVWIMPILESALGVERAFEIATASGRVVALTIGLEDYTADLGVPKTRGGEESAFARARLVQAAAAVGLQAIDSVYGNVDDLDGLRKWGRRARAMGYTGMGCVHPRQIPVIHEAFAPSREEIARALRIVAAFEEGQAKGLGVVSLGSKMIDPPVVERARNLVDRARAMGLLEGEE